MMTSFIFFSLFSWGAAPKISLHPLENPPSLGKTSAGQELFLGGFSGLHFLKKEKNELFFVTHTDRGPNPENTGKKRPFALPDYTPEMIFFSVKDGHWHITKRLPLRFSKEKAITGMPNKAGDESPTDLKGTALSYDENGLDLESLAIDAEGNYWFGDEYGPSLVQFDKNGFFLKRLLPGKGLPAIYSTRKLNRGFEGVAIQGEKIFGFLQSPLSKDKDLGRIVEVSLKTAETTAEYFYPFEKNTGKIGDVLSLGTNEFLVLEQNSKTGKDAQKKIFKISLAGAQKPVSKVLLLDLSDSEAAKFEKIEGLAQIDTKNLALITDNDFGISGKPDKKSGKILTNNEKSQLILITMP